MYADFNRDGKLDIAFAGSLLLGNGDGTFKAPINLSVTGNLVATADFNGDGNPDLLVASTSSTVLNILLGNGQDLFSNITAFDADCSHDSPRGTEAFAMGCMPGLHYLIPKSR